MRIATIVPAGTPSPGAVDFVRLGIATAIAQGSYAGAAKIFEGRWPTSVNVDLVQRAAVQAGAIGTWGATLAPIRQLISEFVALVRPRTVLGRLTGVRRVPFQIATSRQTIGASVGWVGEGQSIPATKLGFEAGVSLGVTKIGAIVAISKELGLTSAPGADVVVTTDLVAAVAAAVDAALLDPTVAAVPGVSPASITNGATEIPSTGSAALYVDVDFASLFAAITTDFGSPFLVMRRSTAIGLARLRHPDGGRLFPDVDAVAGGMIWGVPVLLAGNLPAGLIEGSPGTVANTIVLVDAAELMLADDGEAEIDAAEHASIEMNSDPADDATATITSLWQHNMIALRALRLINWQMRRSGAVAVLTGVPF